MAFFVNLLAVSVVTCSFIKHAVAQNAQVQGVDNAEQFALLCRIYNVAKNPPINHVDLQDPSKIVEEIDAINASFADEKALDEAEQMGNSSDAQVNPTTTREAAVAQAMLKRITKKAHTILNEIMRVNATRDIEKVKDEFAKVIFGEGMNESQLRDGVLKNIVKRADACGVTGLASKGASAGNNLVVDFFCLCAMTTDKNGIGNVCGVDVGGNGGNKPDKHGWGPSEGPYGSASMWSSIKKGCGTLMHQHRRTTEEGHEVISDFLKHLKRGGLYRLGATAGRGGTVKGSNRKEGMLGTAVGDEGKNGADLICDGSRGNGKGQPPAGICVYYGQESDWQTIRWLVKLKTALTTVDALNNKTATIQRDIQKLQMLLHRAEEIYETAKVISEIQHPVVPPNLHTAAKRLTAYSSAWTLPPINHLILLFVLL